MKKFVFIALLSVLLLSCSNPVSDGDYIYMSGQIETIGNVPVTRTIIFNGDEYYVIDDKYAEYTGHNVLVCGEKDGEGIYGQRLKIIRIKEI